MELPCKKCISRAVCVSDKHILCIELASYIAPKGLVIPLKYIHAKKFLKNLKEVRRGRDGYWLYVPWWLTVSDTIKKRRRDFGLDIPHI